jgi:hypothetical protein
VSFIETVADWDIRDDGPGIWASDTFDRVSVWVDGGALHYESSHGGDECDIPLAVIDRLREMELSAGKWVESATGYTRVGANGRSDAHVVRVDERTWGICTHCAPCLVWVRTERFTDFVFADEVIAAA